MLIIDAIKEKNTEIAEFLSQAKQLIEEDRFVLIPRSKNMKSLAKFGISLGDAKNEILTMVSADYHLGPDPDNDPNRPGEIWVFKKSISGNPFYIKLKICSTDNAPLLKCISFHKDET